MKRVRPTCLLKRLAAIALTVSAVASPARAAYDEGFLGMDLRRLGFTYLTYSGDRTSSFAANGATAFGLEFATERGNRAFTIMMKTRLEYGTGAATFNDAGTARNVTFTSYNAGAGLGLKITPVPVLHSFPIIPYFGGSALGLVSQVSVPASTSYVSVKASEVTLASGYDVFVGVQFGPATVEDRSKFWFVEAALRRLNANYAGNSQFQFDGLTLQGGFGW